MGREIGCTVTVSMDSKEEAMDLDMHILHVRKMLDLNGRVIMKSGHYVPGLNFRNCPDNLKRHYGFV